MPDDVEPECHPNWRDTGIYEPLLALDRRAWAWQCLSRNEEFSPIAASMMLASTRVVRADPLIAVVTLPQDDRLAPWGLHFRATVGPSPGDGLCRVACRL